MIRVTPGSLAIGPMQMASGSGGGGDGPPHPPKAPIAPGGKKPSWWEQFLGWLKVKLGL